MEFKQSIRDTLTSQVSPHIISEYPRFFEFLEAYYEWLGEEGNPYERIRNHMDYMSFKNSLDDYVSFMKQEYLVNIPEDISLDRELFIKLSKKFNLIRGSHASYKFLFKALFNDQDVEIYLPKENILRASDGIYISGQNSMLITNSNQIDKFEFQRIFQKRNIYEDQYEYAYATVQNIKRRYLDRYNVLELVISDIEGEFKSGFPIESDLGGYDWIIPTISNLNVIVPGNGFVSGKRLRLDSFNTFDVERISDIDGSFDTRLSSFLNATDISVFVNNSEIFGFNFDGRVVSSNDISIGDVVKTVMPVYEGYIIVDDVDSLGEVLSVEILDNVVGGKDGVDVNWSTGGSGLQVSSVKGEFNALKPYWENTQGFLSSDMFLLDSFYYQNYSYVVKTEQALESYKDIVLNVLHPSGNLMFAQLNIILGLDLTLKITSEVVFQEASPIESVIMSKYGLGANYSFYDKFKFNLTNRIYSAKDFDNDYINYVVGEAGYGLESVPMSSNNDYEYDPKVGWMSAHYYTDLQVYTKQEYTEEFDSGDTYFEDGYITRSEVSGTFIGFTDEEYSV